MKQTTPVLTDEMKSRAELYIAHGQDIIAPSTYQMLRGAFSRRNYNRIETALRRASKHDADIQVVANMDAILQEAQNKEELIADCKALGDTLAKFIGDTSYDLEQERSWKLIELQDILQADDIEAMKSWKIEAGEVLLQIQAYNAPGSVATRLHAKLSLGTELICPVKQAGFQQWLDSLENLVLLDDQVELLVWVNKARSHLRTLNLRAMERVPNTVSDRRRRRIEDAQVRFRAMAA